MKRRNVDTGKQPRRPAKRTPKFADGFYGSSFVYVKFVIMWMLILLADFILEFRFEYIWPFWLLIQSVYDTFKYQGLAYSVFFVCIAITSDTVCLLFIPIQWLFFVASTYVWMHYVWHTEKGFCPPTFLLWLLFMYVEATIRLRDVKSGPFHVELCRPFAAHCIGHPVVTLGIGLKSYILYRFRLRTQAGVQKENYFYYELVKRALPKELHRNHTMAITDKERNETTSQTNGGPTHQQTNNKKSQEKAQKQLAIQDSAMQIAELSSAAPQSKSVHASSTPTASTSNTPSSHRRFSPANAVANSASNKSGPDSFPPPLHNAPSQTELDQRRRNTTNNKKLVSSDSSPQGNKSTTKNNSGNNSPKTKSSSSAPRSRSLSSDPQKRRTPSSPPSAPAAPPSKDASNPAWSVLGNGHVVRDQTAATNIELISTPSVIVKLEATISKLKSELQVARKSEMQLKYDLELMSSQEKTTKSDAALLRRENESLQSRLYNLFSSKERDKLSIQSMEKRLKTEADYRSNAEKQLKEEKRRRKEEEECARNTAAAIAESSRTDKETAEVLKKAKKDLEDDIGRMLKRLKDSEEECGKLKKEVAELQNKERAMKDSETLMSALEAMQDKNLMLENSLSSETRLKLDLFSALGEVKRQYEIAQCALYKRDAEVADLKARLSELLSILPDSHLRSTTPHYSTSFLEKPPIVPMTPSQDYPNAFLTMPGRSQPVAAAAMVQPGQMTVDQMGHLTPVHLDPNAAMYTPNSTSGI